MSIKTCLSLCMSVEWCWLLVMFNNGVVDELEIFSSAQLSCWTWVKYYRKRV